MSLEESYGAAPAVLGVDVGAALEKELDDVVEALAGGDVESRPIVDVAEIDIDPGVKELVDSLQIAFVGRVHQPHPRIHLHLLLLLRRLRRRCLL